MNTFGSMPTKIAEFLELPNPKSYTGHCFRRSSATILAAKGVDLLSVKRHGGWKSSTVAEGYIQDSLHGKIAIADQLASGFSTPNLGKTTSSTCSHGSEASSSNCVPENIQIANVALEDSKTGLTISNCQNVKINFHVNK